MSQKSGLSQVFGLIKDVVHLGAATIGTGIRITGEGAAKARPHVKKVINKVQDFTIVKSEEITQ